MSETLFQQQERRASDQTPMLTRRIGELAAEVRDISDELRTILARGAAAVQDAPVLDPRELWGEESPRQILERIAESIRAYHDFEEHNPLIGQGLIVALRTVERELAKLPPKEVGS